MASSSSWGPWMGVKHGEEVQFIFGNPLSNLSGRSYTEAERQLSLRVMKYFTQFAKTGYSNILFWN